MFETPLTVVGHIVNNPERRQIGTQEVIKFRVASNSRRRTAGVGAALGKGAPVIAVGHVYTSEYEDRDGNRRSSLEMRATSVGPDVSRAIVRIEKPGYTGPSAQENPEPVVTPVDASDEAPSAEEDTPVQPEDSSSLPLSA